MIAAREFTTAAEIFANAKAVRAKFFPPASRAHQTADGNVRVSKEAIVRKECEWERGKTTFDEHVLDYKIDRRIKSFIDFVPGTEKRSADSIVEEVVADFPRYTVADIRGPTRVRECSYIRMLAIYAVRLNTNMSLTAIGNFFGWRDQTTILSAIRRMEVIMQKGRPETKRRMNEDDVDRAFAMWIDGVPVSSIAETIGVSGTAIHDLRKRRNWPERR